MRCKGTTKSGSRCKRNASGGTDYCSSHADQAPADPANPVTDSPQTTSDDSTSDALWSDLAEIAAVGVVIVAAFALHRVIRLL